MNSFGCGKPIAEGAPTSDVEGGRKVHLACYALATKRFEVGEKILKILSGNTGEDCIVIVAFCIAKIAAQGRTVEVRGGGKLTPDQIFEIMTALMLSTACEMYEELLQKQTNRTN